MSGNAHEPCGPVHFIDFVLKVAQPPSIVVSPTKNRPIATTPVFSETDFLRLGDLLGLMALFFGCCLFSA